MQEMSRDLAIPFSTVADLLAQAERMRAEVERLGPHGLDRFDWSLAPRVRLIAPA